MINQNFNSLQTQLSDLCLLNHDFYKILWNEGKLSKEDLKYYSEQYYFIEENFLNNLQKASELYQNNKDFSNIVNENILDEIGDSNPDKAHLKLWTEFASFCG